MAGPTFGITLGGKAWIQVHGEETRTISARAAYAVPYLLDALRDLIALYEASPGRDPYFVAKAKAAITSAEGR